MVQCSVLELVIGFSYGIICMCYHSRCIDVCHKCSTVIYVFIQQYAYRYKCIIILYITCGLHSTQPKPIFQSAEDEEQEEQWLDHFVLCSSVSCVLSIHFFPWTTHAWTLFFFLESWYRHTSHCVLPDNMHVPIKDRL